MRGESPLPKSGRGLRDFIDGGKDRLQRTEGKIEVYRAPRQTRCLHRRLVAVAIIGQKRRGRALESIDRLLLIAYGEQSWRNYPRSLSGKEIGSKALDNGPLLRAIVLRLVDQDVIDPAIELIEHPFGRTLARQKAQALVDEIVEIERAELSFSKLVAFENSCSEMQERGCRLHDL